ncbi:MAG: C-GCAxxG-C-C family protein [bacterium]|nr:C_GCAxxG_C_C family protein [Bacillota bacterium]
MNEREERISLRADRAKRIFLGGANCAESIWQAFSEGLDQDEQALGNCLASGFGGGLGSGDLCGAIAGGIMVLGLHYGRIPGKPRNEMLKELCQKFYEQAKEELGSVYCRDLRDPEDENYREKCAEIVAKMAALIEKILEEGKENS